MRRQKFMPQVASLEPREVLSGNLTLVPPPDVLIQEGQTARAQFHFVEAVHYPAIVAFYGLDAGAPAGAVINATTGEFQWTPPRAAATYQIGVHVQDDAPKAGLPLSYDDRTLTVRVFDNPPVLNSGPNEAIVAGQGFARTISFADPDPDTWTGWVNYGDGAAQQPLVIGSDHSFTIQHTYGGPGQYTVVATVADSQGGTGYGRFAVTVGAASPPVVGVPTPGTPGVNMPPSGAAGQSPPTPYVVGSQRQLRNLIQRHRALYRYLIHHNYQIVVGSR